MSGLLGSCDLTCAPPLKSTNAICKHFALALTHLANRLVAKVDAILVSFGKNRCSLLFVMRAPAVVSRGITREHLFYSLLTKATFQ